MSEGRGRDRSGWKMNLKERYEKEETHSEKEDASTARRCEFAGKSILEGELRGAVVMEETKFLCRSSEGGEEDAVDCSEVKPRCGEAAALEEEQAGVESFGVERGRMHPYETGVRGAVDEVAEAITERRNSFWLFRGDGVQTEVV